MLACLLASLLSWQDPAPPAPAPDTAPPAAKPAVVALDDRTAKEAVKDLELALKDTASLADKNRALDKIADRSHERLLKPLATLIEKEKSVLLRKRAAVLLRNHPPALANPAIRKLLANPRVQGHPGVAAELVRSLAACGYTAKQWSEIQGLFEVDYHAERVPLHEALLDLITQHKEKQAVDLLLRNLDEPVPENEHDASNPPAEYWEARWKAWAIWKGKVQEALFAITGQRFSTAAEARAWLAKNPPR